jgi:aldehyde:ferredoxin oxidoreductase
MPFVARMLSVDLSNREILLQGLPEAVTRQFLCGRGINAWLLAQRVGPGSPPLCGGDSRPIVPASVHILGGWNQSGPSLGGCCRP